MGSALSFAFLAQSVSLAALALGLGEWLALLGQLASLGLLGLVAWKVMRADAALKAQLECVARRAQQERREILEQLERLDK
jgi:hypothetical protein